MAVPIVRLPAVLVPMLRPIVPVIVPVKPVVVSDRQTHGFVASVTVPLPLLALNMTSSEAVGSAAPDAPPDVVDHLPVAVPFHEAVPPTQNRFAITEYQAVFAL